MIVFEVSVVNVLDRHPYWEIGYERFYIILNLITTNTQ